MFGAEVADDQTVPALLERRLGDADVKNLGVQRYGLGQAVLRLEDPGLAFDPDHVVLVVLLPQDVARAPCSRFVHSKPSFRLAGGEIEIGNTPVPKSAGRSAWQTRSYFAAWLFARPRRPAPSGAKEHGRIAAALLERAAAACARSGARLSVVLIQAPGTLAAYFDDPDHRGLVDHLRMACRLTGLECSICRRNWRCAGGWTGRV